MWRILTSSWLGIRQTNLQPTCIEQTQQAFEAYNEAAREIRVIRIGIHFSLLNFVKLLYQKQLTKSSYLGP